MLRRPRTDELDAVERVLREWQADDLPVQLHPGDLGWYRRFGAERSAAALAIWSRADRILAVGLLDGPGLLRLGIAPEARQDEDLAEEIAASLQGAAEAVLPRGAASVEARLGEALRRRLLDDGWEPDEPWTPLKRDLTAAVKGSGMRIEVAGPANAAVRAAVQRAAFDRSTFTDEHWRDMASGSLYADARCLIAYDDRSVAVAAATVWSAGRGRPGLLEPMGVHRDHRGRGYGTAITLAAAAALRELGSSSAVVCTSSANVGAIATYRSAGFEQQAEIRDLHRDA